MQLCWAPESRGVPIPHPLGWWRGGGEGAEGEAYPRDEP